MTNAEARCSKSLRPRKPEGSLGRTAQDGHLDSHTAPELCAETVQSETLLVVVLLHRHLLQYLWPSERATGSQRPVSRVWEGQEEASLV